MHEKTLLYGALAFTTLAASFGVYHAREGGHATTVAITPVALTDDTTHTVSQAEVPIRLTSSDGTGLRLASVRAEAAIDDPLALTELHLVFENPEDRILEGTFRITLPQGASLSRFAMKVGNEWQEGEVVEKQAARQAYEDFLHRRQDPALMEQGAGNEFSARVFPIPARGTKEIIVSYSEVLEAGEAYVLPLRGLPMLGALDVNVHASGAKNALAGGRSDMTFGVHQQRFTPGQDFVVEGEKLPRSAGLRSGNLAMARVVPFATSRPEPVRSAVVLVDTSASRGLGLAEQTKLVKSVLAKLPSDAVITVACFDQEVVSIYEGKAAGFGEKEIAAIKARGALGASDFEGALAWAGDTAKRTKAKRVILVGDGVATEGETDAQKLREKMQALRDAGVDRMDAIAVGGIRDDAFLRTVVRGVLDRDGVVLDGALGADALARRLGEATSSGVPVKVEGATWSWPQKLDGLQAGDEVMVYAEMDPSAAVRVSIGTQQINPDLRAVERPILERAWAKAKIESLIEAPTENEATTKRQIIDLSTRHRVMSPFTAMLVLETDRDYARFGIDRNANADILTVRDGRFAVVQATRDSSGKLVELEKNGNLKGAEQETQTAADDAKPAKVAVAASVAATPTAMPPSVSANGAPEAKEPAEERAPGGAKHEAAHAAADPSPIDGHRRRLAPIDSSDPWDDRDHDELRKADKSQSQTTPDAPAASAAAPGYFRGGGGNSPGPTGAGAATGGDIPQREHDARATTEGLAAATATATAPPPVSQPPATPRTTTLVPPASHAAPQPRRLAEQSVASPAVPVVRPSTLVVERGIGDGEVQRVVRGANQRLRACYTRELARDPSVHGQATVTVVLDSLGQVKSATVDQAPSPSLDTCVAQTFKSLRFAAPGTGDAKFTQGFDFVNLGAEGAQNTAVAEAATVPKATPYDGKFKVVMDEIARGEKDVALDDAKKWQTDEPGDVMALVALGEAYEARGDVKTAARAYGSILELFSFRADSRRFAGERLERLSDPSAIKLAIDTYQKAVEQRPDHPASHRLYAYTLLKHGEYEKAFEAIKKGASRTYPAGRFLGADRILREDMGLVAAAWAKAEPGRRGEIMGRLHAAGGTEESGPSLRFVLVWETDANDVDFHIHDAHGGHAYYASKDLPSGGSLYADVTTGYGPECFTIRGPRHAAPYTLQAHYYSRGPMGYGMGKLEIIDHDGKGGLTFDERPFVVMVDHAFVDLGSVGGKTSEATALLEMSAAIARTSESR